MHMALFLFWTFAFWPMIIGVEYLWMRVLEHKSLFAADGLVIFVLFCIWMIGMVQTYRLHRWKQGLYYKDDDEDEDPKPNTLIIVEAPNEQQLVAVNAEYVESEVYFGSLPAKGKRLVLNEKDEDDSTILGTVDEVAEGANPFADGKKYRVWVRLDKPDDYEELYRKVGWDAGNGDKRRSTTPAPQAAPQVAPA